MQPENQKKIAVIDLNLTLYRYSSKDTFFWFLVKKHYWKIWNIVPMMIYESLQKLGWMSMTDFKENFFNYLNGMPPERVGRRAEEFWQQEFPRNFNPAILKRVEELQKENIEVWLVTGTLELYVKPLMACLPLNHVEGTRTQYKNGTYEVIGKACKGKDKVRRVEEVLGGGNFRIVEAYSDKNEPILKAAERAFLVKDGQVKELMDWDAE